MSNKNEYKLSVVVLVYNTEAYLEDCLNSLVNQTLDKMEIICVNDESKDNSLNILKKYAKKYDNIKIIDQKNAGGANAGNRGLKEAKGEYVALVDSDDIVVEDAYEKMYNKAKETDSDIVSGKPYIYLNGYKRLVDKKIDIWDEEKTFTAREYPKIYYDVFYWNKIYKREFIEANDIYMIPGKLYADVPLVFRAYNFANKISTITDFVYYWRKRSQELIIKGDSETSVSKSLVKIENMEDRLSTYYYLKDYFKEANQENMFNYVIKTYLERFFYPIRGILKDELFEDKFTKEISKILNDIDDLYNNDLTLLYNLYCYFILNNMNEILKEFINFHTEDKTVINEGNKSYWGLKYFRNPKYNIPDELFEIKKLQDNFIQIEDIYGDDEYIYFNNISIPTSIKIDSAKIVLGGLTRKYQSKKDNIYKFDLESIRNNHYNVKIPIKEIKDINNYDILLEFTYNGRKEFFRVKRKNLINEDKELIFKESRIQPHFTKFGNFSIVISKINNLFDITITKKGINIKSTHPLNYKILIGNSKKVDDVNFNKIFDENKKEKNEVELIWKYSVDKNVNYKIFYKINKKQFLLTTDYFTNFKNTVITYDNNTKIKISENSDKSISIKLK